MKILIATGPYPPEIGGPATYTKLLEERLPPLGFEVSVLPFKTVRHLPKILRHAAYAWRCFHLARHADVVLAQDTVSVGFPSVVASMLARKKFLVRVTGDYAWEQGRQRFGVTDSMDDFQGRAYGWQVGFLRALQNFVVQRADKVIVPSEYMKKLVDSWGAESVVIYNGVEMPVTAEPPAARPSGFLVVSSGRRVPWKGFEALERVVAAQKEWSLYIAEGLPRAQALGWVKAADVYVLNSSYEGLSHALIEAMSLGVPIIVTAVGGNPELVREGVEGLLIPPQDDDALQAALQAVAADPDKAKQYGAAAALRAKEFSIEHTLEKLSALLHSLK